MQEKKKAFIREVEVDDAIFEQSVNYIEETGAVVSYLVDITERKRAELALRESEERYALAARAANDGLWDWNIQTNEIYFSSRWKSMLGFEENEIGNSPYEWFNRVHPEESDRLKVELTAPLEGISSDFKSEYRMLHKDGTYRWIFSQGIAVKDTEGKIYRMVGSQTDITSRKKAEAQLFHDAFHDALTSLPNRTLLIDRIGQSLKLAKRKNLFHSSPSPSPSPSLRQDYLFAVLFLDLDRFKVINDNLGHQSGDMLLKAVVERLVKEVRSGDTIARIGGDEFVILAEDIQTINDIIQIADRIQKQLQLPFNIKSQEVFTSASIGIAFSTGNYNSPEEILRDADIAMYRAKRLGKARYEVFDPVMDMQALTILQLENDLRRAIERQELTIKYQPIVELASGSITGFEALIRWHHPTLGSVEPSEFIPVAEETGSIVPIGYWILRQACRQLYIWQQRFPGAPPLTISVNMSSKQFREPDLVEQIQNILLETGISASTLKLEITESAIMENARASAAMLVQLRNIGVQIYIDDFGTGYSSLSYLHQFPFDALKIDRSFISRMCHENEGKEIVQTIVNLAGNLGVYFVAEGVETADQQQILQNMNYNGGQAQGYYFSKPLDSTGVEDLMTNPLQWRCTMATRSARAGVQVPFCGNLVGVGSAGAGLFTSVLRRVKLARAYLLHVIIVLLRFNRRKKMNNDFNQNTKDSQIINAKRTTNQQNNIAPSNNSSEPDNEKIIIGFIKGEPTFIYNQELQVESQMDVSILKTYQGELIGVIKTDKGIKYALIKEKGNKNLEIIQEKLTENSFVDLGYSKTKLGFIEYKQYQVPEGYQINYTTARVLWKIWWPSQSFKSQNNLQLNVLISVRGQWYPIKNIVVHEGNLYIKTLAAEVKISPSDKITWLNKVEKEESEEENQKESKLDQSATVGKRYSLIQKAIADEQAGNKLQIEQADEQAGNNLQIEQAKEDSSSTRQQKREEKDTKREEIIRDISECVKSMKQMKTEHQNQIAALQRKQGEEFNKLREQMLSVSKKVANMEIQSAGSLRETSTPYKPLPVAKPSVVDEPLEEADTNNEEKIASTRLLQNLISWLEKIS